jgi:hypothetical protein
MTFGTSAAPSLQALPVHSRIPDNRLYERIVGARGDVYEISATAIRRLPPGGQVLTYGWIDDVGNMVYMSPDDFPKIEVDPLMRQLTLHTTDSSKTVYASYG